MSLPAGYHFRPPSPNDLDAVAEVLMADQRVNGGEAVLDAHFMRQQWARTDFELGTDAWVVTSGTGAIVAYGQARREEPDVVGSWGVVHPDHRGRGIGSALFERIEGRASDLLAGVQSPRFRHAISAGDEAAELILSARGLRPIRHFWHMQIDLAGPVAPGLVPAGIGIVGIEPANDLGAVHAVLEEAFLGDLGDQLGPFDQWVNEQLTNPGYDSTRWLLARDGSSPVGALTASAADDAGWVDYLGVVPSHRGRGIGAALLSHAFDAFAASGLRRVRLNVDALNPTGATAVYERAGMRAVNAWDLWERSSVDD